jgi:hypothetical protein
MVIADGNFLSLSFRLVSGSLRTRSRTDPPVEGLARCTTAFKMPLDALSKESVQGNSLIRV